MGRSDIAPHLLMRYVEPTLPCHFVAWASDRTEDLSLILHSDADFACCAEAHKPTPTSMWYVDGHYTRSPLVYMYERQSCVPLSTHEAEVVVAQVKTATCSHDLEESCLHIKLHAFGNNGAMLQISKAVRKPDNEAF